jgi:hypothetical protein
MFENVESPEYNQRAVLLSGYCGEAVFRGLISAYAFSSVMNYAVFHWLKSRLWIAESRQSTPGLSRQHPRRLVALSLSREGS